MKLKALAFSVALGVASLGVVVGPNTAHASGIPVLDIANLTNAISQYQQMVQQLTQLQNQLAQAKQQYESMTGGRGMGNLARTDSYIPKNWQETLGLMGDGGALGGLADQIRQQASQLDKDFFVDVDGVVKQGLEAGMNRAISGQAANAQVYDSSQDRMARLSSLANQIDGASDMKAISDLQARAAIENNMLMNELIKLQSMNAMMEQQRRVAAEQSRQKSFEINRSSY